MSKFHINPTTGVVQNCRATQKCPFGGESGTENHYSSIKEARASYERMMAEHKFPVKEKGNESPLSTSPAPPSPLVVSKRNFNKAQAKWRALNNRFWDLHKSSQEARLTKEWYDVVQERKNAYYAMIRADKELYQHLPPEKQLLKDQKEQELVDKAAQNFEEWKKTKELTDGPYQVHPEITSKNEREPKQVIQAFTGMSEEELAGKIEEKTSQGKSLTEAYREVWDESELRTDKPIVAIDLEAAAPLVRGKIDNGPYSSIIEVGYVIRYPDGRSESKSYLSGVPKDLLETVGTGAEHVHNISPEMVEGLTPFSDDVKRQEELLNDLRGSVILAHNARYEISQFTNNLPRFALENSQGQFEVLDTQWMSRHFVLEAEDNSNKSLVEATGGSYEGAHRALEDAKMSLDALLKLKGYEPTSSAD